MVEDRTSIQIRESTRERLVDLKPYPSVSYDDLIRDIVDEYEAET